MVDIFLIAMLLGVREGWFSRVFPYGIWSAVVGCQWMSSRASVAGIDFMQVMESKRIKYKLAQVRSSHIHMHMQLYKFIGG